MTNRLLQQEAEAALAQRFAAPQRYGTAFHIRAPFTDVRAIPLDKFTVDSTKLGVTSDALPLNIAEQDSYGLWQLAHLNELPVQTLSVAPGTVQEITLTDISNDYVSEVLYIVVGEQAQLTIYDTRRNHEFFVRQVVIVQAAGSRCTYWGIRSGNTFAHERMRVYLQGPQATTYITQAVVGGGNEQADMDVATYHQAPLTTSNMQLRTAVAENSSVLYRGLITVERPARGSVGYQQGKALMLSSQAVADVLPELKINTNEVRCSHGVSTLHLDDAALFYLRSRGLPLEQAQELALTGFFHQGLEFPPGIASDLAEILAAVHTRVAL